MGVFRRTGRWLIDEWQEAWRFSSLWVATTGMALLVAWNQMPFGVRKLVPDGIELVFGIVLWGAVVLARITRQPNGQAAIDAKRAAEQAVQEAGA